MRGWAMFWLFVIIYFLVDVLIFLGGFDTFFWGYETPIEKAAQRKKLGLPPVIEECAGGGQEKEDRMQE